MEKAKCNLCGEPMPEGEEMFKYHGYSSPCPKPPLPKPSRNERIVTAIKKFVEGCATIRGDETDKPVDWTTNHNQAIALVLTQLSDPQETGTMLSEITAAFK